MVNLTPIAERTPALSQLAPGVIGLRTVMVNVYAVSNADASWVLVDSGLPYSTKRVLRWIERQMGPDARPSCIVLTHGHFDHVGNVQELARYWDVPVYAHRLEHPYLTGKSKYPPPDPTVGRGVFTLCAPIYPRGPINISNRLQPLPSDGSVPGLEGWRWIATPGHSPGHVSFFRDKDRLLLAGDAFATTKQESIIAVLSQLPELQGPPAYYTMDWELAKGSVRTLAALKASTVACGHGLPMSGPEASIALEYLADHFDKTARPSHGRYVKQAAITNENGIVRLPPPVVKPAVKVALGVAVAGGVLYGFLRSRKS